MNLGFLLLAFFIGALISLQGPVNGSLRAAVGSTPVFAAFISFAGGVLVLGAASLIVGERWSSVARLVAVQPWQLTGGLIGACFVFGMTLLAPRIGLANMMSLVVAGQIVGSLLFDRLGWVGLAVRELSPARVGGAGLVIAGVLLVNFGDRVPWLRP